MLKKLILILLLLPPCLSVYAQKNLLNQARSKALKVEREINRSKRDYNKVGSMFSSQKKEVTEEESLSDTIIWEKKRYIPKSGLVNDYAYLFRSIHGDQQKVKFKNTKDLNKIVWDSTANKYYNRLDKINAINENYEVLGWHPYWMKNEFKDYKYNLLSMIAYFSYDVNPLNGGYNDPEVIKDWRSTAMIDSAKNHGVKVLLTVTSYGNEQNKQFFSDKNVWNSLIDSLKVLITARSADGFDLNFEQIPANNRNDYTEFVKKLRSKIGDSFIITLQVPAYNNNNAIDFKGLDPYVNYFIVQGYDYSYVKCNGSPSPVSPLHSINSECPSIVNTYDYCLRNGMNPAKSILGMPSYGTEWTLAGNSWNANARFERYITYDDVMSEYKLSYEPFYDAVSGSTYFLVDRGSNSTSLVWFESQESLESKFQWALDHGMKGAAIWALGYDGRQSGIWNAVATNFGVDPLQEIFPIGYDNGKFYSIMESFQTHRKSIGIGVVIILYFFIIGLFVSLLDWRVREIFFRNLAYRAVFAGVIIFLGVMAVFLISGGSGSLFPLFIGLAIGAMVVYLITTHYISYRNKLP